MQRLEPTSTMTSDSSKSGVGVRRRVEAERLLVGDDRGGHALPRVAVAVDHAHAELGQRAQQRHLLGGDLAGAEKRDRLRAVLGLNLLHPSDERLHGGVPIDRLPRAPRVSQQRRGRAVFGREDRERLPALGAGHAEVDGIIGRRRQTDRLAVAQVHVEATAGRTVTTHDAGQGLWSAPLGHEPQAKFSGG